VNRAFIHRPVLLAEVLAVLEPRPDASYFDGTCGGAGHSAAILAASSPTGFLSACDRDPAAIAAAAERLEPFAGRFELRQMNFAEAAAWIEPGSCAGALLDLGVSSHQLDSADRGFSFQQDGPLDMRMSRGRGQTAAEIVNGWTVEELGRLFWENGEREARRIARAIERERSMRLFETTGQLAACVERACPRAGRKSHPATKVFQAIRIAVNDEVESLRRGLVGVTGMLASGGVLAIITFHSGEDKIVKEFMRVEARGYDLPHGEEDLPHLRIPRPSRARLLTRKPILPSAVEIKANPRARSAQLRAMARL
jgi:16S rRNA (cytosine1402-N4)-methyltransferase